MFRIIFLIPFCLLLISCQTASTKFSKEKSKESLEAAPKLTKPVVRKIWIPEKIEDDGLTMTGGHWKYLIDKGSSWAN
jgi:hypothetical protein